MELASAGQFTAMDTDEVVMASVCAAGSTVASSAVAFGEIVRRWEGRIVELCYRITGNLQDAEDASQDAFTKAFNARSQFQAASRFSTWLWRIAMNSAHGICRQRARRLAAAELSDEEIFDANGCDPAASAERDESRNRIIVALQVLPAELRSVVVLRHYEHLKFREIAQVLDIPDGTVASRMAEAMNRLAVMLREND